MYSIVLIYRLCVYYMYIILIVQAACNVPRDMSHVMYACMCSWHGVVWDSDSVRASVPYQGMSTYTLRELYI